MAKRNKSIASVMSQILCQLTAKLTCELK